MKHTNRWLAPALVLVALQLTACQRHIAKADVEHPAEVVKIEQSDLSRLKLTEKAIQRLGLKTDEVREERLARAARPASSRKVVPYSALIYDSIGQTWVYTSPEPRTFIRHKVDIDYIQGDKAVLTDGPPIGTVVASVGAAELYGTEFKVGH
jgi:hypothetical protein